jgi:hypothetical protein
MSQAPPVETLHDLFAALKKFIPSLRAVTLHDGVREYQIEIEELQDE